jgi:hypothetical protein
MCPSQTGLSIVRWTKAIPNSSECSVVGKQWPYIAPYSAGDALAPLGNSTVSLRTDTRCRTHSPRSIKSRCACYSPPHHTTRRFRLDSTQPRLPQQHRSSYPTLLYRLERQDEPSHCCAKRLALNCEAKIGLPWYQAAPTVPTGALKVNRKTNREAYGHGAWSSRHGVRLPQAPRRAAYQHLQ